MGIVNKNYAYVVLEENGIEIVYKDSPRIELKELYEKVDCHTIEVVHPLIEELNEQNLILIVDEEGKLRRKEINLLASMIFNNPIDVIVGKCVICTEIIDDEEDPDIYAMSAKLAERIYKFLSNIKV